jgi:uncharacterized protein (DUF58 family)
VPTWAQTITNFFALDDRALGRRRIELCPEGWYYLLVLICIVTGAILREVNLLVVLAGLLIGPLVFNWRLASLGVHQIEAKRKVPPRMTAGEPAAVFLEVTNARKRLASWGLIVSDAPFGTRRSEMETADMLLPHLQPGESKRVSYRLKLLDRGRYQFGPIGIATRYPLGLIKSEILLPVKEDEKDEVVVWPAVGRLLARWQNVLAVALAGERATAQSKSRVGGDYYGIREWRGGDSVRHIHWRSSAKRGKLTVREYQQERSQEFTILLDLWSPQPLKEDHADRVELALQFLGTILRDLDRRGGCKITIAWAGSRKQTYRLPISKPAIEELLDQLSDLQGAELSPSESLGYLAAQVKQQSSVFWISTRPAGLGALRRLGTTEAKVATQLVDPIWIEPGGADFKTWFVPHTDSATATKSAQEKPRSASSADVVPSTASRTG